MNFVITMICMFYWMSCSSGDVIGSLTHVRMIGTNAVIVQNKTVINSVSFVA